MYEGCGWSREGAHTYGYNKKSIGIAFIGNFESKYREIYVFFLNYRTFNIFMLSFLCIELLYNLDVSVIFSDKQASQKMLDVAHQLIMCGKSEGILRSNVRVIGARQVQQTASPGYQLYVQIQNWPEWTSNP